MKKVLFILLSTFLLFGAIGMAHASIITSYDIDNAVRSGFAGWAHTYDGTITDIGSINVDGFSGTLADYTGGGGTLNDDTIGTSESNTQLFSTADDAVLTLYLDDYYTLDDMTLYSFVGGNSIPGNITSVDITIGSTSENFLTTTTMGTQHEYINILLGSSGLANIAANEITLSGFTTAPGTWTNFFSISEIDMTTNSASIPEPATMLLLGTGLIGLAALRRRIR